MNRDNYVLEKYATPLSATEPLTLADAKAYMNITSDSQDTLITELIKAARQAIEKATGLSLVPSTVVALIDNSGGDIELPLGPYVKELSIANVDGNAVTDFTLRGLQFKTLYGPTTDYLVCTYKAGYTAAAFETYPLLPTDLLNAIKDQVSFLFENRGELGSNSYSPKAWRTCKRYTRHPLFI